MSIKQTSKGSKKVQVVVRCRPLLDKEVLEGQENIVYFSPSCVYLVDPKLRGIYKVYRFDRVFGPDAMQDEIYQGVARPLVMSSLNGYNACILCYGQSGSGKTYTMEGSTTSTDSSGIILKAVDDIFTHIRSNEDTKFSVTVSYIEIYRDQIRDLLDTSARHIQIRKTMSMGTVVTYITGITTTRCKTGSDLLDVLEKGRKQRAVAETKLNERSSRSHSLFIVTIESRKISNNETIVQNGKLIFVDLAGSERQDKSGSVGERLSEAKKINLSLSNLSNVISALAMGSKYIPYRNSKLTSVLQDCIGGNSLTCLISHINTSSKFFTDTIQTLTYSTQARGIKNQPQKNLNVQKVFQDTSQRHNSSSQRQKTDRKPGTATENQEQIQEVGARNVDNDSPRVQMTVCDPAPEVLALEHTQTGGLVKKDEATKAEQRHTDKQPEEKLAPAPIDSPHSFVDKETQYPEREDTGGSQLQQQSSHKNRLIIQRPTLFNTYQAMLREFFYTHSLILPDSESMPLPSEKGGGTINGAGSIQANRVQRTPAQERQIFYLTPETEEETLSFREMMKKILLIDEEDNDDFEQFHVETLTAQLLRIEPSDLDKFFSVSKPKSSRRSETKPKPAASSSNEPSCSTDQIGIEPEWWQRPCCSPSSEDSTYS